MPDFHSIETRELDEEVDFLAAATCNPNAPADCEACQ